jgi:hypothetical protein
MVPLFAIQQYHELKVRAWTWADEQSETTEIESR